LTTLNIELTDTNCVLCDLIYPETERVAGGDGLEQVGSNPCNSKLNLLAFVEYLINCNVGGNDANAYIMFIWGIIYCVS
jgi:hypothetical protein